jgi:signal transduction histidine kinase
VASVLCLATLVGVRFTPFVSNTGPAIAVAVLTVADRLPRRDSLIATGAAVLATAVAARIGLHPHPDQDQDMVQMLIAIPARLTGDALRTRRSYRAKLAAQEHQQVAERELRIRAEERLQVSRDMHGVVSHTLSMIAMRSGIARLLLQEQPEESERALGAIETASRSALDELRLVLTQLRTPDRVRELAEPRIADLAALIDAIPHDGLAVDYQVGGRPRTYPELLETSAYRIVQEGPTNVVKHARATHAWIDLQNMPTGLTIPIVDDGHSDVGATSDGASTESGGLGLAGMRERLSLFDGTLETGSRPEGGYAVIARFPYHASIDEATTSGTRSLCRSGDPAVAPRRRSAASPDHQTGLSIGTIGQVAQQVWIWPPAW